MYFKVKNLPYTPGKTLPSLPRHREIANFPKTPFAGNLFSSSRMEVGVKKGMNDAFNKYFPCFARINFAN